MAAPNQIVLYNYGSNFTKSPREQMTFSVKLGWEEKRLNWKFGFYSIEHLASHVPPYFILSTNFQIMYYF